MTKSKVSKPNEIKYLGFEFCKERSTGLYKAKLYAISVDKLKAKLRKLTSRSWSVVWE